MRAMMSTRPCPTRPGPSCASPIRANSCARPWANSCRWTRSPTRPPDARQAKARRDHAAGLGSVFRSGLALAVLAGRVTGVASGLLLFLGELLALLAGGAL